MELVVDANVVVDGFLRSAVTRQLLLDGRFRLFAPEHTLTEADRVLSSPRIRKRLGELPQDQVKLLLSHLTGHMQILPASRYQPRMKEALRIAPHPEDAPYLALALHLGVPLWSNDVALARQAEIVVYSTQELLDMFV